MIKTDYPTFFDETQMLLPLTWDEQSEVIEEVNKTEAGTDVVDVSRYDKLKISASYRCTDEWAKTFKEFSKKNVIAVKRYDILSQEYETRNMRMRGFKATLKHYSDRIAFTNGVWEMSFTLEEY